MGRGGGCRFEIAGLEIALEVFGDEGFEGCILVGVLGFGEDGEGGSSIEGR